MTFNAGKGTYRFATGEEGSISHSVLYNPVVNKLVRGLLTGGVKRTAIDCGLLSPEMQKDIIRQYHAGIWLPPPRALATICLCVSLPLAFLPDNKNIIHSKPSTKPAGWPADVPYHKTQSELSPTQRQALVRWIQKVCAARENVIRV